ncbi:uncharacterized protein LOC119673151 [Teleopsis dalmanni]|uniref:uncharacterized protein LOC119673151 n=1 Tax=Teleopsis dalmanni TaxID=139649 RepID=UPI0018CF3E2A|nr:uncharacterized protein LOC119673151 [Teleopsis dalmanni]
MPKKSIKNQIIDLKINAAIKDLVLIEDMAHYYQWHALIGERMDELLDDVRTITSFRQGDELSVPKSIHWLDNILCCFDEGRFLQMLRANKSQLARLVEIFANDIIFKAPGSNMQLPVDLQLAIVLFHLGSSGESTSVRKVATTFGVENGSTLTKITQRVFSAILRKLPAYIRWPSATERRQLIAHTLYLD